MEHQINWTLWQDSEARPTTWLVPVDRFGNFATRIFANANVVSPTIKQNTSVLWTVDSKTLVLVNASGSGRLVQQTWSEAAKIVHGLLPGLDGDNTFGVWLEGQGEDQVMRNILGIESGLSEHNLRLHEHNLRPLESDSGGFNLVCTMDGNLVEKFSKWTGIAKGRALARDWTNLPANLKPPLTLAERFMTGAPEGIEWTVVDENQLRTEGAGGILAVGQGSSHPPAVLIGRYNGNGNAEYLGLVGKGITFDSGGLSLKPADGMGRMKGDMAGAAAVAAALRVIADLKLKANVLAVIPLAENLPGGNAFRPGDVVTMLDGTTVEIISTDAEGRLVLADGITMAIRQGASRLIDMATLTGSNVVSLGGIRAGLVHNNTDWGKAVEQAGEASGEGVWVLPNDEEYANFNKSGIADLKNSGGRPAGTISAGLFIGHFAHGTPWVHIDIAGLSYVEGKQSGIGATGYGVSLLVEVCHWWSFVS